MVMNKEKLGFGILSLFIIVGFLGGVSAATLTVNTNYVNERNAIVSAADRLVTLQNNDGSWDWVVTDATGPTSKTYLNIAGVTAQGVLDAYQLTGNVKYLNSAEKAGDYLLTQYGDGTMNTDVTLLGSGKNINSANVIYLFNLGKIVGADNKYTTEANLLMNYVISSYPNAGDLFSADSTHRGTSNGEGIITWDLYQYIKCAEFAGNETWANDLSNVITTNNLFDINNTNDVTYVLGLVGMSEAGNASAKEMLISTQLSDGSWNDPNGQVQDTAYAITALIDSKDNTISNNIANGDNWLLQHFGYNDINGWKDTSVGGGNVEIAEVDSESIDALFNYIYTPNTYYAIQDAINAASDNDTINVAAGNYTEQLTVDKSITLSGSNSIINAPSVLNAGSNGEKSIITVEGTGVNAEISGFTISGTSSSDYGIFVRDNANANIHDNIINSNSLLSIIVGRNFFSTTGTATITNNTINGYQKGAITVDNLNSNASISQNVINGMGPTDSIAQNGIQISRGATGTIINNMISNHIWTGIYSNAVDNNPTTDTKADGAAGILLYSSGSVTISGNTLTENQFGIWTVGTTDTSIKNNNIIGFVPISNVFPTGIAIQDTDQWGATPISTNGSIMNNNIKDNDYGIVILKYGSLSPNIEVSYNSLTNNNLNPLWTNVDNNLNAQNNYWGTDNATEIATKVVGNVNYAPWFSDDALSQLDLNGLSPVVNENSTSINLPTQQEFDIEDSLLGLISVVIPAGVNITGTNWAGTLNIPSLGNNSDITVTADSGKAIDSVGPVIKLGIDGIRLTFDKAIRILIPGQAGKLAGYSVSGNDFTQITSTCGEDSQIWADANLTEGGDCKIDKGSDLVIWTKHFTTFVTYSESDVATNEGTTSGSSGGGGGSGTVVPYPTINQPVNKENNTAVPISAESSGNNNTTTPTQPESKGLFGISGMTIANFAKSTTGITTIGVIFALIIGGRIFFNLKKKKINSYNK